MLFTFRRGFTTQVTPNDRSLNLKRSRSTTRAMTLIEVMVAMALSVIMIGLMVTVWTTSQKVVTKATNRVEIFQNLRNVLDIFERDISNVVRTHEMEPFNDANGSDHYDEAGANEEFGALRPTDLFHVDSNVSGADGTLPDSGGSGANLNNVPYFFAPVLYSPPTYVADGGGGGGSVERGTPRAFASLANYDQPAPDGSYLPHRRDEFYFRSFAQIQGRSRPAMIHYKLLLSPDFPHRPALQRRLFWMDYNNSTPQPRNRTDDLAEGITDLEFDMFYKESRIFDHGQFLDAFEARQTNAGKALIPGLDQQFNATAVSLYYSGDCIIEQTRENGVWMRPTDDRIQFGAVRPGDKMYIYEATDETDGTDGLDNTTEIAAGFQQRELTVESIIAQLPTSGSIGSAQAVIFVKFVEPIDFDKLFPSGTGEVTRTKTEHGDPNLTRTIFKSFQAKFRIGFLPGAFRVRFKYRDIRERRLIPFERVVRVLGS